MGTELFFSGPPGNHFARHQIVERLPAADQLGCTTFDEHFGRQRLGVVVRAHHEAVGAGPFDDQQVADRGGRQAARGDEPPLLLREDIARLAQAGRRRPRRPVGRCAAEPSAGTIDIG